MYGIQICQKDGTNATVPCDSEEHMMSILEELFGEVVHEFEPVSDDPENPNQIISAEFTVYYGLVPANRQH